MLLFKKGVQKEFDNGADTNCNFMNRIRKTQSDRDLFYSYKYHNEWNIWMFYIFLNPSTLCGLLHFKIFYKHLRSDNNHINGFFKIIL